MLIKWALFLIVFVSASGILGSYSPGKRSDFSMYDYQFYRVGDTELDDEVTDCALVEHQFNKGFIRLREYLERKRGCGRKGKLSNIVGIAKSTEDDINNDNIAEIAKSTTEDYHFKLPSSAPVVKKAPKPKTIPQVIKTYQPYKMAYVPHGKPVPVTTAVNVMPAEQPAIQVAVPRNQAAKPSLNDYESKSQNLALSFKSNPQYGTGEPSSLEHNAYKTQNTQPQIASAFNNKDQYTRLASSNDHYEAQTPQRDLLQKFYPDTLHERSHAPSTVTVGKPLYRHTYTRTQASNNVQSAPNKVSLLLKNAMKNFDKVAVNKPFSGNSVYGNQAKPQNFNKPATKPVNIDVKSSPDEYSDDTHADMRDPDKDSDDNNSDIDQKPSPEPGIDDQSADQTTNKPIAVPPGQRPGTGLRPFKPVSNSLNGFHKTIAQKVPIAKGNPILVKHPQNIAAQAASPQAFDNAKLRQPSINFDVLKNKIMHSTNATFLRRMLALIQKITHHKDYQKLQAPARSFVAQANTAVQALKNAYEERVSTLPVSLGTGNQNYGNDYALRKKSTVQTLNTAYNNRVAMPSAYLGNRNQFYQNGYTVAKKFQIARNPYYQNYYQYRQPYYSNLQSMRYGLYNGNVP